MSAETKVPSLGSVSSDTLEDVLRAVKITLDVREGRIGDPLDANVTYRDLVSIGALAVNPARGGSRTAPPALPQGAAVDGYVGTTDMTIPPRPENFTATGGFALVQLQWDAPAIRNLAYTEIWRADTNVLGNAIRIGTSTTQFYVDSLGTSATRFYWVRFVTQADVTGPYNDTDGTSATTATDPVLVLASLTNQITKDHLYTDLSARIDLIDGPGTLVGSVAYRLAQEATARNSAISSAIASEASNRTSAIGTETSNRVKAIADEALARTNAVGGLQQQIDVLSAASSGDIGNLLAVVSQEQSARVTADTALASNVYALVTKAGETTSAILLEQSTRASENLATATQLTSLIANVGANQSALVVEQTVRSTADSAYSSQFTGLSATVGGVTSGLSVEQTTRANETSSLSSLVTALSSQAAGAAAALTVEQTTRSDQNLALASQITNFGASLGANSSTLAVEQTTRATADTALSSQITSLTAASGSNAAALVVEQTTRATETGSLASQNTSLTSLFGSTAASLVSEQNTRASQDSAVTSVVTGLSSSLGVATAGLSQELATRTTNESALSSQITSLGASFGTNAAAILAESTARASADSANANLITTVQARLDSGDFASVKTQSTASANAVSGLQAKYTVTTDVAGHVSGYGLASSANNGTAISRFGVRASEFFVAPPSVSSATAPTTGLYKGYVWYDTANQVTKYYNPDLPGWTTTPFSLPFVIKTAPETVGDETFPAGVYIDAAFIRDGTITNAKIGKAAIDNAKIASLDASKITTGTIDAARINADQIAANIANIDAAKITSGVINSARIGDATITSAKIADTLRSTGYAGNKFSEFPNWVAESASLVTSALGDAISGAAGAPAGYQSVRFQLTGQAFNTGSWAVVDSANVSVTPGQRYEISVRCQWTNARLRLSVYWAYVNPTNGLIEAKQTANQILDTYTDSIPTGFIPMAYPPSTSISQNIADFYILGGFRSAPSTVTDSVSGVTRSCNAMLVVVSMQTHPSSSLMGPYASSSPVNVLMYVSQPYVAEVSASQSELNTSFSYGAIGWEIKKDGSIVANNITARGDIRATSLSINSSVTSGARTTMTNEVIKVYDASGVLRVKLGNLSA